MQEISHLDPVIQGFYEQLLSIERSFEWISPGIDRLYGRYGF